MREGSDTPDEVVERLQVQVDELAERIHFDKDRPDEQSVTDPVKIRSILDP